MPKGKVAAYGIFAVCAVWLLLTAYYGLRLAADYRADPKLYRFVELGQGSAEAEYNAFLTSLNGSRQSAQLPPEWQGVDNNATYQHFYEVSNAIIFPWFKINLIAAILTILLMGWNTRNWERERQVLGTMLEEVRDSPKEHKRGGQNGLEKGND